MNATPPTGSLIDLALGGIATRAELLVLEHGVERFHLTAGAEPARTRFLSYSTGKMLAAQAVLRLVDAGQLSLDTRVAALIPEFAQGGKEDVRVEEVLTHSSGFAMFPGLGGEEHPAPMDAFDLDVLCDWVCGLPLLAGQRGVGIYHAQTWAIVGRVVERASGRSFVEFCDDEVFKPLGMRATTWGLPLELRELGAGIHPRQIQEFWEQLPVRAEDGVCPAGNAYTTAADVARVLTMLSRDGEAGGRQFLSESLVREAKKPRVQMLGQTYYLGYGLFVNGDGHHYARGSGAAPGTFGHSGATANQAFHDPVQDLTIVALTNGLTDQETSDARYDRLCDEIYRLFAQAAAGR